ncbi:MAG: GIY-YIG nuclease family protein [Terracidiphilus sp.]|jgi:hypothetical protein
MRDKQFILSEIQRTAALNNGKPVGQNRFKTETGIAQHEWRGIYWARWGDALLEAGFQPLEWNQPSGDDQIIEELVILIRKYKRYPVKAEILIEKRTNTKIPTPNVILRRFGERANVIQKIHDYCADKEAYVDVVKILAKESIGIYSTSTAHPSKTKAYKQKPSGYVYLVKSGKLYKIGFAAENPFRRKSELHRQTSEGIEDVHTITAIDDAPGIERYWHERFKEKRQHGEWFELTAEDVRAFKKRKFM